MNIEKRQQKLKRFLDELKAHTEWSAGPALKLHYQFTEACEAEVLREKWQDWPIAPADLVWGGAKRHHWFATEVEMPQAPENAELVLRIKCENVVLMGRTQGQGLVWLNGKALQGVDGYHPDITLANDVNPGETATLHINHYTGDERTLCGYQIEPIWRDTAATALFYDLNVPFEVALRLDDDDLRKYRILELIDEALLKLDYRDRDKFAASLPHAAEIAQKIYALKDTDDKPLVSCVGHTHIDVAWLWPVSQTREKMMRSMATALKLLDENPDFVFMYNQCVLLDYLEQDAPDLFARVMEHVRSGRFEIEGAMWLEPDVNIISGESMIRQIQRGKRYHMEKFGVEPKILWLPDTFGYSAAMPQIMRKAGVDFLVTSKLSWSDTNRIPYDAFFWHGIDGTAVNTYLITTQRDDATTFRTYYEPDLDVSYVKGAWKRFEPKQSHDNVLVPYGHGDGGGGVTQEMIEVGRRMVRGIPGSPKVTFEGIKPFLDRLGDKMEKTPDAFPKWVGELYLEFHRGTLTSLGKNKKFNRDAENRLKDLEFVIASNRIANQNAELHSEELGEFWRVTLLNQFHDILPGTSIEEVYEVSDAEYADLFRDSEALLTDALSKSVQTPLALINATGNERSGELVYLQGIEDDDQSIAATDNQPLPLQSICRADGTREHVAALDRLPPMSIIGLSPSSGATAANQQAKELLVGPRHLENAYLRADFSDNGEIVALIDKKTGRSILRPGGRGNRLEAFEDKPLRWDAWDIEWYFDQKSWPIETASSFEVIEQGPHRAALRVERTYNKSRIVQIISLTADGTVLEFDSFVDWKESQTLLKAGFDLEVQTSEVKSEIQFGHVSRPTHENTSWDFARFEASMHKWVALSEQDYAVALINDSKYGYDSRDGGLRITLVKSGTYPFETADQEEHRFRYGLTVANGRSVLTDIARRAECFSHPLHTFPIGQSEQTQAPAFEAGAIEISGDNIAVHAFKVSENNDEIVIRLVEEGNLRSTANVSFGFPVDQVRRVDLMDQAIETLDLSASGTLPLSFTPFEIVSLAVTVRREQ